MLSAKLGVKAGLLDDEFEPLLGSSAADRRSGPRLGGWMDGCWGLLFLLHLPVTGYTIFTEVKLVAPDLLPGQHAALASLAGLAVGMAVLAATVWIWLQFALTSRALSLELGFQFVVLVGLVLFLCVEHLDKWYWLLWPCLVLAHLACFLWSNWHPLQLSGEIARGVHAVLEACWGLPIAMVLILIPGVAVVGSFLYFSAVYWAVTNTPFEEGSTALADGPLVPRFTVLLYLAFSLYWSVGTLVNVAFLTAAQTVCCWCYDPRSGSAGRSLVAAWSKGLGTASFAALAAGPCRLLFAAHLVRYPYKEQRPRAEAQSLASMACLCGECISLETPQIVQVLNASALAHVALHGRGFCASARSLARERGRPGVGTLHSWNLCGQLAGPTAAVAVGLAAGLLMWACVAWIPDVRDKVARGPETRSALHGGAFYIGLAAAGGGLLAPLACFVSAGAQALVAVFAADALLLEKHLPLVHAAFRVHVIAAEADEREPLVEEPGPEPA